MMNLLTGYKKTLTYFFSKVGLWPMLSESLKCLARSQMDGVQKPGNSVNNFSTPPSIRSRGPMSHPEEGVFGAVPLSQKRGRDTPAKSFILRDVFNQTLNMSANYSRK
jgi:hypothetical protein